MSDHLTDLSGMDIPDAVLTYMEWAELAHKLRTQLREALSKLAAADAIIELAQAQRKANERVRELIADVDSTDDELRTAEQDYQLAAMRFDAALAPVARPDVRP